MAATLEASGWLRVEALEGTVTYQGDGGGGGVIATGASVHAGPGGDYRPGVGPPRDASIRIDRMAAPLLEKYAKRSRKLLAWERLQLGLRGDPTAHGSRRRREQGYGWRARTAVAETWARVIALEFRALMNDLDLGVRRELDGMRVRSRRGNVE